MSYVVEASFLLWDGARRGQGGGSGYFITRFISFCCNFNSVHLLLCDPSRPSQMNSPVTSEESCYECRLVLKPK